MKINQYQVVFLVAAVFLGYWVYSDLNSSQGLRGSGGRASAADLTRYEAPDFAKLPDRKVDVANWPRDLFSPPRDTEPLAPLTFVVPPMEPMSVLAPPGLGGPLPEFIAPHLRRTPVRATVPGLFAEVAGDVIELLPEDLATAAAEEGREDTAMALSVAAQMLETLDSEEAAEVLAQIRASTQSADLELDLPDLTPSERLAANRKIYDWVLEPTQRFGRIANADRYRLDKRPTEAILFVQVDPETGKELYPGQAPLPFSRDRVESFGFADTVSNSLEIARVTLGDTITPATQSRAIELARRCLNAYTEAPRALEIARDLCDQVVALEQGQHLEGRMILARLHEVDFDFEQAFAVYNGLLTGPDFSTQPVVMVGAGSLYARLGVWSEAEALFRRALKEERSNAGAHLELGKLLLKQGKADEALTHLAAAESSEPRGLEAKLQRLEIRLHHGMGLLALGRGAEAKAAFARTLALDEQSPRARAGLVEAARLHPEDEREAALNAAIATLGEGLVQADFALSLAQGLLNLEQQEWVKARRYLELAAEADPFQSHLALGGLAYLAEQTGYLERAMGYLEQALEVQPQFAWAHYTRGRILIEQGDLDEAAAALRKALELELNFPDALVAMARAERADSDYPAAKLYLERALQREPENASWLTLAGFNAYALEDADGGRALFQRGLESKRDMASAGLAEAWWHYMSQDSTEAITRFGEWVEKRRNFGETDPFVVYAEAQSARIVDHDSKELWTDRFERRPGRIGNGWSVKEGLGPTIELKDGAVRMQGLFTGSGRTRIYNSLAADSFLSLEARVTIGPDHRGSDVGLFLGRERSGNGGAVVVQSEVAFQRNADGQMQYRVVRRGEEDVTAKDLSGQTMEIGSESIWTLEKVGVGSDAYIRLFVDGEPVLERLSMPTLGTSTQVLRFGLFVDGQANRSADVTLDDVRIVRRRK